MAKKKKGESVNVAVMEPDPDEGTEEVEYVDASGDTEPPLEETAGDGVPADEALSEEESKARPSPAQTRLEQIWTQRDKLNLDVVDEESRHNATALELYHAENRVKWLRKCRETSIASLAAMKDTLKRLDEEEQTIREAPAPLFEEEIANEWREMLLAAAGIEGKTAELLIEAGIERLGDIAALTDSGGLLSDVKGIGPEKVGQIADKLAEFFAANPRYCRGGEDEQPLKIPSRIRVRDHGESDDGYAWKQGEEFDVDYACSGQLYVTDEDGNTFGVPWGAYAILGWKVDPMLAEDAADDEEGEDE